MPQRKGRILSGLRPTGKIHLGNLEGALRQWVSLQDEYECFYEVADWHALTTAWEDPSALEQDIRDAVTDWLSVGLDPDKSVIFVQSSVPEHSELHLLLSMIVPVSWLELNPTYKDWLQEGKAPHYGLLGYPVLQAADILIYRADTVPVGKDQLPHLEMTREIARRFNRLYGNVFPEPQALLSEFPYVPGMDGRKMSKSYHNHIQLADPPQTVQQKVSQFFTDPHKLRRTDPGRPEICPVFALHKIYNGTEAQGIGEDCRIGKLGCVACKERLAGKLNEALEPIRERRARWEQRPSEVDEILAVGAAKARQEAVKTMEQVRAAMKLWSPALERTPEA
ncbi:MAG: tryptophan--tRNA ligase [Armatimonadetes bacterium]|nr:tryptophan--tRNA ligase [Armatimonadota bacterium]MDW8121293.1 tryptophan--tRNA ligase [Armatimonadota bacterium]